MHDLVEQELVQRRTRRLDRAVPSALRVADAERSDARGLSLRGADLSGTDLSGWDFSGADLSGADLTNARLSAAKLVETNLGQARLDGCEWLGADLSRADLRGCSARGAGFGGAVLEGARLEQADVSEATFSRARLAGADLRACDLRGARLLEADLRGADLTRADLRSADLAGSQVGGACFLNADLRAATIEGVGGYRTATWIGADIRDVRFSGAYLIRRHIMDANYLHEFRSQGRAAAALYWVWWATSDCGRSFARWGVLNGLVVLLFAAAYHLVGIDVGPHDEGFLSSLYFSVVTMTTLGYGDIQPCTQLGQALVMVEVVIGYMAFGGLCSLFGNKMSRRAG